MGGTPESGASAPPEAASLPVSAAAPGEPRPDALDILLDPFGAGF